MCGNSENMYRAPTTRQQESRLKLIQQLVAACPVPGAYITCFSLTNYLGTKRLTCLESHSE